MTEQRTDLSEDQLNLGDFFFILVKEWWVVVIVFTAALVVALALWLVRDDPDPVYETTTKLLIVAPVSGRILSQSGVAEGAGPSPGLSAETLFGLATAKDLLQTIIEDLDLQDAAGQPISVEILAGQIDTKVGTADSEGTLPLLSTTVQGTEPDTVARIAGAWAETFAQKNGELVTVVATGLFDLAVSKYQIGLRELESAQSERLLYELTRENDRLAILREREEERLRQKAVRRDILTSPTSNRTKIELKIALDTYEDFLGQLEVKRAALAGAQARLDQSKEALAAEDPVLVLERGISNEALFSLLAGESIGENVDALQGLVVVDEERNDLYFLLKEESLAAESEVTVLEVDISYLADQIPRLRQDIERLSAESEGENLGLQQFNDETTIQQALFTEETSSIISDLQIETGLRLIQFDHQIDVLDSNLTLLIEDMQTAEITKNEGAGAIRLVEAAFVPSSPIPTSDPRPLGQMLLIGAMIGLVLAPLTALAVHAIRRASSKAEIG